MTILQLILIFLLTSVLAVVLFRSLNLPPMLGYLSVGAIIAPYAKQWIPNEHALEALADFGVVFLMFSIGLEFSLSKLKRMRKIVIGMGGGQFILTTAITTAVVMALGWPWQTGVIFGLALTMSSTAIGGKMLDERGELDTKHGHAMFGILLLQDMLVAPTLIVLPLLSHITHDIYFQVGTAIFKIIAVFVLIFWLGKPMIRWWFRVVAAKRSHELFMLNLLLLALGGAYLTSALGLSTALGALLAGMIISETEFRFQTEEDIKPFQDILLGLFFITVGMMLDPSEVGHHLPMILAILVGLLCVKGLIVFGLGKAFKLSTSEALRTALGVCAAGEFGFVVLSVSHDQLSQAIVQPVLAAMVLSMFIAPFLIIYSDKIVSQLIRLKKVSPSPEPILPQPQMLSEQQHIIICGYGETGQIIGQVVEEADVSFVAIDSNPELIRQARSLGKTAEFGDCSRSEILLAAGLEKASGLVVSFNSYATTLRILEYTRRYHPNMPVIVRTGNEKHRDALIAAGAMEVIADIFESALTLSVHALAHAGLPVAQALRVTRSIRQEQYGTLRGGLNGEKYVEDLEEGEELRLHTIIIPTNAASVGHTLSELDLLYPNVTVSAIHRGNQKIKRPSPKTKICSHDRVTLLGRSEALSETEDRLLKITNSVQPIP